MYGPVHENFHRITALKKKNTSSHNINPDVHFFNLAVYREYYRAGV